MRALFAAALLGLAACSSAPQEAPAPPPSVRPPAPQAPVRPAPVADACGAAQLQHLVGRPRSEIPVPVHPERQRVACTTCMVTQDFSPDRLNFFFDAATGLIREIRCG